MFISPPLGRLERFLPKHWLAERTKTYDPLTPFNMFQPPQMVYASTMPVVFGYRILVALGVDVCCEGLFTCERLIFEPKGDDMEHAWSMQQELMLTKLAVDV